MWLSTIISAVVRCTVESRFYWFGMVNSPLRRKPKNPKQQAAHSIISLNLRGGTSNAVRIALRMRGVIGRQVRAGYVKWRQPFCFLFLGHALISV